MIVAPGSWRSPTQGIRPAEARSIIDGRIEAVWSSHISDEEAETIVEVMERVLHAVHDEKAHG